MAKNPLKTWFEQNDGKGWIDCKTGKPCGRKKERKEKLSCLQTNKSSMYISSRKKN